MSVKSSPLLNRSRSTPRISRNTSQHIGTAGLIITSDENSLSEYGTQSYWEERYKSIIDDANHDPAELSGLFREIKFFDWYQTYSSLKIYIYPYLQRQKELANSQNQILKVLNVGCGNSMFGEDMFLDDVGTVVNIDYSGSIIQYMKKRADGILAKYEQAKQQNPDSSADDNNSQLEKPQLLFIEMDITKTLFQENSFDSVFDKGTIDSLVCSPDTAEISKMVHEVSRILKPGGYFFIISSGLSEKRLAQFDVPELKWKLVKTIDLPGKNSIDHLYIFQRNSDSN